MSTVSKKNVTLFTFVISLSDLIRLCYFFGRNITQEIETNTCTGPIYISFYMFVLYLVKTSDASERTQRRRLLPVRIVIEPVWNEMWLPVHLCLFQISWGMFLPRIGKIGWHLI